MPVIINSDAYDLWLDPEMKNVVEVCELLRPFDAWQMRCYALSNRVNYVANDDEECSRPVEPREDAAHAIV
jgi:putative SOS response-associated peptidase YedK